MERERQNTGNYAKELEAVLRQIREQEQDRRKEPGGPVGNRIRTGRLTENTATAGGRTLLLHSCCAPCSSYVMEYLREYFSITVYYYNPNITEEKEYRKRVTEEKRLIAEYNRQVEEGDFEGMDSGPWARKIEILEGEYEPQLFYQTAKGLEQCPEGGERCLKCYELRLRKTAQLAAERGFDYFTTTLTISPLKNARKLNEIGERLAAEYGTAFLPSDFKKRDGYKRSVELSRKFGLYRQDYCGCIYSRKERDKQDHEGNS